MAVLPPPPGDASGLVRWLQLLWNAASRLQLDASGPTITQGTGVPTSSQPSGSVYLRTDGGAGSTIYVREGASWTPK